MTTNDFINKAHKVHGDKFDYSDVVYVNSTTPVKIVCPVHGEFMQLVGNHLAGKGCKKCAIELRPKRKVGYWTKERVFEVAHKYIMVSDFANNEGSAYFVARKNKWLSEMNWLKRKKGGHVKWTEEEIIEAAKNYEYQIDFENDFLGACKRARKLGIISKLGLKRKKLKNGHWKYASDEDLIKEAMKYDSRSAFSNSSAHKEAKKRGLIDKIDWPEIQKVHDLKNMPIYCVYVYVDKVGKAAYIGLTFNLKRRDYEHRHIRRGKKDAVLKYFDEIGVDVPQPKVLEKGLFPEEAQEKERFYSDRYYERGYLLLNKRNMTGIGISSLGAYLEWTPEKVIAESQKYKSKSEFKAAKPGAYNAAVKFRILDKMPWIKPKKRAEPKWSKEQVFAEARKYQSRHDFRTNSYVAYIKATEEGWLAEMDWLDTKRYAPVKKWTREAVFTEGRKYNSKMEFRKGSGGAYHKACDEGWIKEMDWFEPQVKPNGYWTKERVFEESRKYSRRSDFAVSSPSAYNIARAKGWLDEMTWLVQTRKPNGFWTKETIMEESRKYRNRTEFARNADAAYRKARINGWLEEMVWLNKSRKY